LGALWLQFARDVCQDHTATVSCQVCQATMRLAHVRGTGQRADALFCGDECRHAWYRAKKREARTLRAQGNSLHEIAAELGSPLKTVKGWVQRASPTGAGRRAERSMNTRRRGHAEGRRATPAKKGQT